ncbi:hypothetical protein ABPG72_000045 [Tetrahymena utriculariae]
MEEVIQKCTNCKQIPDDILMLSCDHDLCLNCAAQIFVSENLQTDSRLLTCLECGQSTELDQSSVLELQRINVELQIQKKLNTSGLKAQKQYGNINQNSGQQYENYNQSYMQNSSTKTQNHPSNVLENFQARLSTQNYQNGASQLGNEQNQMQYEQQNRLQQLQQQPQQLQSPQLNKNNYQQNIQQTQTERGLPSQNAQIHQQIKRFCQEHSEEEILYYCFQCQSRCICPECVIHGAHKNHEVKTIKKAYPIVKQKVEEFEQKMEFKIKQINQRKTHLETVAQEINQNSLSLKKNIALAFTEIKQKIEAKEREILQICDQVLRQNLKEIENLNFCLEEKLVDFKQILELVFDHENQPDETLLLDFFSTNQAKLDEITENREWEKKLLFNSPEFYQVNQREIQKQLALVENDIQKIEPQLDIKDKNLALYNGENQLDLQNQLNKLQNEHISNSQNQTNNSQLIRDSQSFTPSANKKSQIHQNQFFLQPQQYHDQQQLSYRSPVNNMLSQENPFRTQQISRDQKITDADFEKFRERISSKSKISQNQSTQLEQQQQQQYSVQPFTSYPSLIQQQNTQVQLQQQQLQQYLQQLQQMGSNWKQQEISDGSLNINNSMNNSNLKTGQQLKQ